MKIIKSSYTQTMHHVFYDDQDEKFNHVFAISYAFDLYNPKKLLPMSEVGQKIQTCLEAYQCGLSEGYPKQNPEVLVYGQNVLHADAQNQSPQKVTLKVGEVEKSLYVYPERKWVKDSQGSHQLQVSNSNDPIYLSYHYAYGRQESKHNPLGIGEVYSEDMGRDHIPLPRLEAQKNDQPRFRDGSHQAISFSPMAIHFPMRQAYLGQYTKVQQQQMALKPSLPHGTDARFFQQAPKDQWLTKLDAKTTYTIEGMSEKVIRGKVPNNSVLLSSESMIGRLKDYPTAADTVQFFPNEGIGIVMTHVMVPSNDLLASSVKTWVVQLKEGPVSSQSNASPSSEQSDLAQILKRREGDAKHLNGLKEDDLVPASIAQTLQKTSSTSQSAATDLAHLKSAMQQAGGQMSQNDVRPAINSLSDGPVPTIPSYGSSNPVTATNLSSSQPIELGAAPSQSLSESAQKTAQAYLQDRLKTPEGLKGLHLSNLPQANQKIEGVTMEGAHVSNSPYTDMTFHKVNMSGAQFSGDTFTQTHFEQVTLNEAQIGHCVFEKCTFVDVRFDKTKLLGNHFKECNFTHCSIDHAHTQETEFESCMFDRCQFNEGLFYHVKVVESQLLNTQMIRWTVAKSDFEKVAFTQSQLRQATFDRSMLAHSTFDQCKFEEVGMSGAVELDHSVFKRCNILRSNFAHSTWRYVSVENGLWSRNDFEKATLSHLTWKHVQSPDTDWVSVALKDSQLSYSNFTGSNWTNLQSSSSQIVGCELKNVTVAYAELPMRSLKAV